MHTHTHTHTHTHVHTHQIKKLDVGEGGAPELSEDQLASLDKQAVEYEITMLEERLKQLTPNMAAIEEYRRKVRLNLVPRPPAQTLSHRLFSTAVR